jgi:hypothetical protein
MDSRPDSSYSDHVHRVAAYDTLREVANQLAGLLVARKNAAPTDEERDRWQREHLEMRRRVDTIDSAAADDVARATDLIVTRLQELRAETKQDQ